MHQPDALPIAEFETGHDLRSWLEVHHSTSDGIWLRIYMKGSDQRSVTFAEVLDEDLCFGWSESTRHRYDQCSYLQRFMPRQSVGTCSVRNKVRAEALERGGKMTPAGWAALGLALSGSRVTVSELRGSTTVLCKRIGS